MTMLYVNNKLTHKAREGIVLNIYVRILEAISTSHSLRRFRYVDFPEDL